MAQLKLRRARPRDANALADLHMKTRRESLPFLPQIHNGAQTRSWMRDFVLPGYNVWAVEVGDAIAGYIALDGEIVDQLYVLPEYQHRGIGTCLLEKARQLSPHRLTLWCYQKNAVARAFYEKHGFVALQFTDGTRNEEHEPDLLYGWTAPR